MKTYLYLYLLVFLGIGIILSYIIYKSRQTSSPLLSQPKIIQPKYSAWSACDCNKKQKTRKLLEGDPAIFGKPSLLVSNCLPEPSLCCKYSDWDKCDCNKKKRRTLLEGDYELCQEPLIADCIPDSNECCRYSEYSMCDCQTKKQRRSIVDGNSLYCLDPLERDCSYGDYKEDCCNGRGVYSMDSSGNRGCDCSGTGFKGPKCEYSNLITCNGNGDVSDNGFCYCNFGFKGNRCESCAEGRYGPKCDRTRSSFCYDRGTPIVDGSGCICDTDNSGNTYKGLNCQYILPSAPIDLSGTEGDGQVSLAWKSPYDGGTPITKYKVYINGDFIGSPYPTTLINYIKTGLTNGTPYSFSVSAVNIVGEGSRSTPITKTPRKAPDSPTNLSGTRGNKQVTLTWDSPLYNGGSDILRYKLYRNDGEIKIILGRSYIYENLNNGTPYTFNVSAINDAGEGHKSNSFSIIPATKPNPPTNFYGEGGRALAKLYWNEPSDNGGSPITNYIIYADNSITGTTDDKARTYTVGNLWFANYYMSFNVAAKNEIGIGDKSPTIILGIS